MKGIELIEALKKKFGVKSERALSQALGLTQPALINWRKQKKITPRILAEQIHRLSKGQVSGPQVVAELHEQLDAKSQKALARHFGVTLQAVQNWKRRTHFSPRHIAQLVRAAQASSLKDSHQVALRPLVEFFPISKCESRHGAKFELFSLKTEDGKKHPYLEGLRKELESKHGVYIFFDSRGQAIYAGKARKQSLWRELTGAFNRERGAIQKIWRVKHPSRKQPYRTSEEKTRQIDEYVIPLYELAHYFSAYQVADGMVGKLEALLVRSFANDLLNKRMETFGKASINS